MLFAIQTDQTYWIAGDPAQANYVFSRALDARAVPSVPMFSARGAGWASEKQLPLGNTATRWEFSTLRTFDSYEAAVAWDWLAAHPWYGTLMRMEADPATPSPLTYKVWKSSAQVVLQPAGMVWTGVSVKLSYSVLVPSWTAQDDYVPSAPHLAVTNDAGLSPTDEAGHRVTS